MYPTQKAEMPKDKSIFMIILQYSMDLISIKSFIKTTGQS